MKDSLGVSDIVATENEGGVVRVTLGDSADGSGTDRGVAQWGMDGFVSCPNEPDTDGAAQALYVAEGQEKRVLGTRDYRNAARTADLEAGDRAIVSACEARLLLKRSANAILLEVGDALVQIKAGEIKLGIAGGGSITIDKQGVRIEGTRFAANTTTGNLGLVANLPPMAPANSVVYGPSGQAGAPSASWTVAP